MHSAVTERHGVRVHTKSWGPNVRHSLSACLQKHISNTGKREEAMDESSHIPHGEEVEA